MKIKRAIVLPDLQLPFTDHTSLKPLEQYMKSQKWDFLIYMGDFLDYFCISKFNEGKPGAIEGHTIMKELKQGKDLLEKHIDIVRKNNPKCRVIYLEGNHEYRAYDWVKRFPHLKGLVEYIRSWSEGETFNIGKAFFTHGDYTNIHHAKKMVEAYEENIFYGHTHDLNSFNKTARGTGKTKVGQSLGTLCHYPKDIDYTKGKAKNWNQAFGVFYFLPNEFFNYYVIRIFHGAFVSPEGDYYDY